MAESAVDDENFELIDYTSASAWEKFAAAVESQLRAWKVGGGGAGDFDFDELRRTCSDLVVRRHQDQDDVVGQVARLCTRTAQLTYNGSAYTLTLSAHPLVDAPASKRAMFDSQFPPTHVPELELDHSRGDGACAWHPLHRWTGRRMLLHLRYAGDAGWGSGQSPAGDNYSVSLETAKLLMSSLNMALRNARCQLAAFVPVGDAWRRVHTGRAPDTKYECVSIAQAPAAYLQLSGLLELFVSAFGVPPAWDHVSDAVHLAALHQYRVTNTYARDWNARSADFVYRMGDLNVGPATDPLRVLTLSALFGRAPCRTYMDGGAAGRDRLYLKAASAWRLSAHMLAADRERAMLTETLEDAFAAWAQAGEERHRHLNMAEQMEAHAEVTGDMLIDLFGSAPHAHITPPGIPDGGSLAAEAARQLAHTLAEAYADGSQAQPPSAAQVIARMAHGTAVPHGSLLWRLSEIVLVATAKRSADFWGAPSIMTFLRLLWAMALKEMRWRWEHARLLPRIPAASDGDSPDAASRSASGSPDVAPTRYDVHLRYALVHQKLEMLNCCVERRIASGDVPEADSESECSEPAPDAAPAGLAQRIRTHVRAQIQRRLGDGARLRPIGRLLHTVRPRAGAEIGGFEAIEASDSDGFVSAEDIDFDDDAASDLLVERPSPDASEPARLPSNAVRRPSSARLGAAGARDSCNYVDLALSSSVDSSSGFHHVSDVYERPGAPAAQQPSRSSSRGSDPAPLGDDERAGGLRPSPTLRLLGSAEPLWIPRIQAHPVVTEDMLREREAVLMGLGTSSAGARQRARLQCAELISDMQAFKAANPHCALADFVRWHSPRDWIVGPGQDEHHGRLSARMAEGGAANLWQELWADARRIPAHQQPLLFDHSAEAEKVLHYLEGLPPHALFASLLPTVFLVAYERLYRQPIVHRMPVLRQRLSRLADRIVHMDWPAADSDSHEYASLLDGLEDLEVHTSRCVSLLAKLPAQYALVEALVTHGHAIVDDRAAQKTVLKTLAQFNILTAQPTSREYVFTARLQNNADAEQQMYVAIDDDRSIRAVYGRSTAQASTLL
ncbi:hypothetical protein IWW52_003834 [Coemansia sp. RSA 2704]|nr:hypothetical protein IWW52_003834 [Coemansia sp. RSA 2704]